MKSLNMTCQKKDIFFYLFTKAHSYILGIYIFRLVSFFLVQCISTLNPVFLWLLKKAEWLYSCHFFFFMSQGCLPILATTHLFFIFTCKIFFTKSWNCEDTFFELGNFILFSNCIFIKIFLLEEINGNVLHTWNKKKSKMYLN